MSLFTCWWAHLDLTVVNILWVRPYEISYSHVLLFFKSGNFEYCWGTKRARKIRLNSISFLKFLECLGAFGLKKIIVFREMVVLVSSVIKLLLFVFAIVVIRPLMFSYLNELKQIFELLCELVGSLYVFCRVKCVLRFRGWVRGFTTCVGLLVKVEWHSWFTN